MDRFKQQDEEIPSPILQPTLSVGSTKPNSGKPTVLGGHLHTQKINTPIDKTSNRRFQILHTFSQVDTLVKIRLEGAHADRNETFHIVGNRPELGNWLPTSQNELKYFRDECWLSTIKLKITATGKDYIKEIKDIEYKYVKVRATGPENTAKSQNQLPADKSSDREPCFSTNERHLEWEKVSNRKVSTYDLLQIGRLNIEDCWSKRRVVIRFIEENEENTEKYSLHIIGDIPHLGQLNLNFKKMKLVVSKVFGKPQTVWETSFYLDYNIDHFYYTYVRFYRKKKKVFFDRNRQRECILSQAISEEKGKETTCDLYYSGNTFFKIDLRIDTELKINEFTPGILFGPYPQLSQDYRRIFDRDVKRIVNLMTGDELMQSLVDGVHLHKKSATHNLDYASLEYDLEVPYAKRIERLKFICQKIHHMVLRNEKIYVCEMFGWQKISEVLHHLSSYHLKSSNTNNTIRESPH